ncbi:MAG TPA: DUF2157 domain-containing protein [Actinomycetota bacterium]
MDERRNAPEGPELPGRLDRWVTASLITREQADAILRFETSRRPGAAPRSIPLVTEALAYLGAALALAALFVFLSQAWDDLRVGGRVAVFGVVAAAFFAGGFVLRANPEPAMHRLGSVLWALSAGFVGGFAAVLALDGFGASDRGGFIAAGAGGSIYAGALYAARRQTFQQAALAAGLVVLAAGLFWESPGGVGIALVVLGLAWLGLGWLERLEPRRTAFAIGALGLLIGPLFLAEPALAAALVVGVLGSAGLIVASIALRQTVLLGLGTAGLFVYLTWAIGHYLGETIGLPLALLVAGLAAIAVAVVVARIRPLASGREDAQAPA